MVQSLIRYGVDISTTAVVFIRMVWLICVHQ